MSTAIDQTRPALAGVSDQGIPGSRPIGLVVLGMHRSGTSALTRVLNIVGADLPAELLGATAHNPTGHWELSRVYDLHNRMLAEVGGRWDDWRPISTDWLNSPKRFSYIDRIASILTEEFADSPLFVLKDPRICRLLSLWKEAFIVADMELRAILPVRNPLDVSQSLLRRGGTSTGRGLLIWLRHVLDAEAGSRDIVRTWTSYNRLLDDWRGCLRQIGRELNVGWPRFHAEAEREVDLFLDKSLRHHNTGANILDGRAGVPTWVANVFEIVSDFLKNGETDQERRALDGIRDRFDDVCSALMPAVSDELADVRMADERRVEALARTEADLKTTNAEIAQLRQHLANADQKLMDLEQVHASLAAARTEIKRLLKTEADCAITEADLASAKNQLAIVSEQLIEVESRGTTAELERSRLAGQLAEAERQLVEADSRGTTAELERSRLAGQLAEAERQLVEADSRGTTAELERSRLAGQLAEAERQLVEADSRGTTAELERSRLAGQLAEAERQLVEADSRGTTAELERSRLAGQLAEAERQLVEADSRGTTAELERSRLAGQLAEAERQLVEADSRGTTAELERSRLAGQLAEAERQLVEADSRGTTAELERSRLAGQLAEAERQLVEADSRGPTAELERSRLAGQLAEAERKLASMAGAEATLSAVIGHLAEVADRVSATEQDRLEKGRGKTDHKLVSFVEAQVTSSFESLKTAEFAPPATTAPLPRQATPNIETTPRTDTGWELAETALVNENPLSLASGDPTRDAGSNEAQ